jgi:dTMP kinase
VTSRAGVFLVVDGPDGGGKSTQARRLAERVAAQGRAVVSVREPGGTAVGERVRAILLDPDAGDLDAVTEVFLFQAARRRLVEERIRPALARGAVVVCDRWHWSTAAYQGAGGGAPAALVESTSAAATGGLAPRRSVLLDVPPDVAARRIARPLDRVERRGPEYAARVREAFLAIFRAGDPDRFRVVRADRAEDDVAKDVWEAVRDVL